MCYLQMNHSWWECFLELGELMASTLCSWGSTGWERDQKKKKTFSWGQKAAHPSTAWKLEPQSANPPIWPAPCTLQPCSRPLTVMLINLAMSSRIAQCTACWSFAWWRWATPDEDRIPHLGQMWSSTFFPWGTLERFLQAWTGGGPLQS